MKRRTFISGSVGSVVAGLAGLASWQFLRPQAVAGVISRSAELPSGLHLFAGADLAFGTTIGIQLLHHDQRQAELAIEDAFHEAKKIDALMSIYSEQSQVFQLNRDGRLSDPDPHLLVVLKEAQRLSVLTEGAFDITVQPLWIKFSQAAKSHTLPPTDEVRHAKSLVNWRNLSVSPAQIAFNKPGMAITLNGMAQGYAVDLALAAMQSRGIRHALLDTGEFISTGNKSAQRRWTVGVQDPRDASAFTAALQMDGRSVATSGDYETTFTPDFVHNHIFDPATGDSPLELASVTVVAPTGLLADGMSTALFVLGSKKAMALAAETANVDVLLVDKQGKTWKTRTLRETLA
ncbi:FAD:protein FMN transferase [Glaciimonas immobilis]|uniref:FAD:protein FMN transferase n=1 Tax=Glaciimonas immobilis TaxID=728004 RepID=A0A840RXJ3_9BURK|nr:FAD:protein FMN transferase [Glaciimonas immobilis]KAF3998707.1 FAD:protein FMN transferase [Glaciimonas immobilis]MBB5201586.1 thiamine biosynthesis lipoprotein [Glaciimonas immobilis]